jgi:hypothetical protein
MKCRKKTGPGRDPLSLQDVRENEKWIEEWFSQHFLVDSAWEQLAEYYLRQQLYKDQRRILHSRCGYQSGAYPGLSGSHAWSLEAFADALKTEPRQAQPKRKNAKDVWMPVVKAEIEEAKQKYLESLRILRLMFGEDHEYATSVDDKLIELVKCIGTGDDNAS